ncbi:hypothetical protein ACET3Z_000384 [Daucus carota]
MKVLYQGKQREISFKEITDESYLAGKVLPMELSEHINEMENSASALNKKDAEEVGKQQSAFSSVHVQGGNSKGNNVEYLENRHRDDESEGKDTTQIIFLNNYRHNSSSSEVLSVGSIRNEELNKSEIDASCLNHSSQSTLCSGIVKKLKVRSNRGRPKKSRVTQKNPFDIGVKFRIKRYSPVEQGFMAVEEADLVPEVVDAVEAQEDEVENEAGNAAQDDVQVAEGAQDEMVGLMV